MKLPSRPVLLCPPARCMARRRWTLGVAGVTVLACMAPVATVHAGPAEGRLEFGLIAPREAEQTRRNWQPFAERMEKALGLKVNLRVFDKQDALVRDFVQGRLDLAWVGNAPALTIVEKGVGAVFAQMVMKDGNNGYKSVLVTRSESALHSLRDVIANAKSLTFGDGDPKSTSGHLVPYYFAFQKNGVSDTRKVFKSVTVGSHQENLKRVASGEVDVATANDVELEFFKRDFPGQGERVRVVWQSPLIPQSPLVWHQALPVGFKKKLSAFVTSFGASDPEEKAILLQMNGLLRLRPSSNLQLVPIADLEMFKARQAIVIDEGLSPEERAKRLNEAIQRGSLMELKLKLNPF